MAGAAAGRTDQVEWLTPRGRRNVTLAVMAIVAGAGWQLAVAFTCGVGLTDVGATWAAISALEPVSGLPGRHHASPDTVLATWGVCVLALGGLLLGAFLGLVYWRAARRVGKGLARKGQVQAAVGEERLRKEAAQTLPSMPARTRAQIAVAELGFSVGIDHGSRQPVVLGFNESIAVIAPSGGGKSTGIMTPAALEAPGPLVVTSNEVSILDQIATTRTRAGRVWVFDPLDRSCWPHPMVYDPVAGCADGQVALARGTAFVAGCGADGHDSTNSGFFKQNSKIAMKALLHAAALDGRSIEAVLGWVPQLAKGGTVPRRLIRESSDPQAEQAWDGELQAVATGADDTVASTLNTLTQVVEPLTLKAIRKWIVPCPGVPTFDAGAFVRSRDTLVLLSDDSTSTNVGPLATMLFQEVVDAVKAYAPFTAHGRLEPPMRVCGDEIANIAPIDKLPEMTTELRKLGVQWLFAFQSERQAQTRWGADRGRILLEQMAAEVVLPGVKSVESLNRYSDLAGMVEVVEQTLNRDAGGERTGTGGSVHERKVLRPDEIRQMPDGRALLMWRNAPAMIVDLLPWYERDYADQVATDEAATRRARVKERQRRDHAESRIAQAEAADQQVAS